MKLFLTASLLFVALCMGEASVLAQTSPRSPAVFGGAATREEREGGLDGLVELFHAYDDNVLAGEAGGSGSRPTSQNSVAGQYSGLSIAAIYNTGDEGRMFKSWVNTAIRYYPELSDLTSTFHQVGATLVQPLGRRLSLQLSPSAAFSPQYTMQLFPHDERDPETIQEHFVLTPDVDFAITRNSNIRLSGAASLNMMVSDQSSFTVRYGYGRSRFVNRRDADLEVRNFGGTFSRRFSRNASLRIGYSRQEGNYRTFRPQRIESLNIGMDYQRPLSRSRRTFVRFTSGSVIANDGGDGRRMQVAGSASLAHQIGRTWIANLDYRRSARYIDGFELPVFSDAAFASISGLLNRRLEFNMSAGYFTGTEGLSTTAPRFNTYMTSARLRTALSRTLAAYLEYRIYRYRFDEDAVRPFGAPPTFARSGARIGLSWFIPLVN